MKQISSFVVCQSRTKYPVYIRGIRAINRSCTNTGSAIFFTVQPIVKRACLDAFFFGQSFKIGSKSLVKPYMMPTTACNLVSKPLVSHFVYQDMIPPTSHKSHSSVFHSSTKTALGMAVFFVFKWVCTELFDEKIHHCIQFCGLLMCISGITRKNIIQYLQLSAVEQIKCVFVNRVFRCCKCHQICRNRISVLPMISDFCS